jgi:hypothetical protein
MTHREVELRLIGQPLEFGLPQARSGPIASPAIGNHEHPGCLDRPSSSLPSAAACTANSSVRGPARRDPASICRDITHARG